MNDLLVSVAAAAVALWSMLMVATLKIVSAEAVVSMVITILFTHALSSRR